MSYRLGYAPCPKCKQKRLRLKGVLTKKRVWQCDNCKHKNSF